MSRCVDTHAVQFHHDIALLSHSWLHEGSLHRVIPSRHYALVHGDSVLVYLSAGYPILHGSVLSHPELVLLQLELMFFVSGEREQL